MGVVPAEEQTLESVRIIKDLAGNPFSLVFQLLYEAIDDDDDLSVNQSVFAGSFGICPR
jgi:hypothetical protein